MSPTSAANTLTVICLTALSDWRWLYFVKIVWIMNMYNAFRTDNKFLIGHETNLNMRMKEGNSYLAFSISRCQDTTGWVEAVARGHSSGDDDGGGVRPWHWSYKWDSFVSCHRVSAMHCNGAPWSLLFFVHWRNAIGSRICDPKCILTLHLKYLSIMYWILHSISITPFWRYLFPTFTYVIWYRRGLSSCHLYQLLTRLNSPNTKSKQDIIKFTKNISSGPNYPHYPCLVLPRERWSVPGF